MENSPESDVTLADTWEGRMRQVASCELPYEQALRTALDCVEVAERYSDSQPQSMSPATRDANLDIVVNLASALQCEVRLAVFSLYHGDQLVEHDQAVEQLLSCGQHRTHRNSYRHVRPLVNVRRTRGASSLSCAAGFRPAIW